MKLLADKGRTDRSCSVGDWVYVKLQSYGLLSLRYHAYQKLLSMFFEPFKILAGVGAIAYT